MSHNLLISKIYTTFKDVQMMLKWFFDISTGLRFSKISVGVSISVAFLDWGWVNIKFSVFCKNLYYKKLALRMPKKKKKGFYQRKFLALNSHPFFVCVKYLRWRVQPWGVSCIQLWEVPVSEKKPKIRLWTHLVEILYVLK